MANNVAYTIQVDTSKAVKDIIALEEQIAILKKELVGLKEGTEGFDTLSSAIKGLESNYNNLIQTAEKSGDIVVKSADESAEAVKAVGTAATNTEKSIGKLGEKSKKIDLSQPFKNVVKIGAAVTASFAAAQSVFTVFGADSTKIAEASAKAQALLTVAIAAREAAEAVGAGTTLSATIATKLKTAADNTQITVLKRLYTLLANNPYAIIAVGVGLLVTAFIALTNATDDATKAQEEFQKGIDTEVGKEVTNLNILISTINDTTQSIEARKNALETLKSKFPSYFKDLKDEDILSGKVKISTDELTKSIIAQAQARALQGRIEERAVQLLDIERKLLKTKQDRIKAEKEFNQTQNVIISGGATAGGFTATGDLRNAAQDKYLGLLDKENELKNEQNDINVANAIDMSKILDLTKQTGSALKIEGDNLNDVNKATKEQIALAKELENALNDQLVSLEDTADVFRKLGEAGGFQFPDPEVLTRIKELKNNIEGLIPEDLADKFKKIGLDIIIKDGTYEIKELGNEVKNLEDIFGNFIEETRKELSSRVFLQTIDEFANTSARILKDTSDLLQKGLITKVAFDSAEKLINQYKDLNRIITELPEGVRQVFTKGRIEEYLDITKQLSIATGKIKYEKVNGQIVEIKNSTVDLTKETERLVAFQKSSLEALIKLYEAQFKIKNNDRELTRKQFLAEIENLKTLGKLTEEDADKLSARVKDTGADFTKLIKEIAEAQLKALNNTVQNIIAEETQIRAFLFEIQQDRIEALKIQGEAEKRILLNNLEDVFKITQTQNAINIDATKTKEEQVVSLLKQFADKKIDLTSLTEEEQYKIVLFYLGKQKEAVDQAQKTRQEQVDKFVEAIQQIQMVLNSLSQTSTAFFNQQFDTLEKRYKRVTDGITGDSKRSAELRIEAEKAYQAERERLEKKAAKTSLRIALAQSLANTAEAVSKTVAVYGGTPLAIGAAAAVAVLSAAQTAIIAQQLANIDSYRKGGRIKMAGGGLVQGKSHEYGGVKFQGGGIELEGNESVINRVSTINYMGLLSQINQAGGGKPIGPGFDDSRIVEAIAKQRNTPIRAFVVESDITQKQTTAKKIQELASF